MRTRLPAGCRLRCREPLPVLGNLPHEQMKGFLPHQEHLHLLVRACLTWRALGAPHSHAAAVLGDAVVCDFDDDLRVGLQVEQQDVVRL